MKNIKVLFICKKRSEAYGISFGLINSCLFICNALKKYNIESKVVSVVDNNCLHGSTKVTTENGVKTIKRIVDTKYSGKILSLGKDNKFEWNKVTNWWSKSNIDNKTWINIITKPKSKLVCTEDHRCAVVDNPLIPNIFYKEAKDIIGKYIIKKPRINDNFNVNSLYNGEQISVIIGTLLGDGHIDKRNVLSCGHSVKQIDYLKYKVDILNGKYSKEHKTPWGYTINSSFPVNAQTQYLRELTYIDGIKNIKKIIDYIDDISLAFWYMDDGVLVDCSYKQSRPHIRLCTHSYTHEEHELLIKMFSDRWGINPVISKQHQNGKTYEFLEFHKDDSEKFWKLISKYIPKNMQYKIPEKFRSDILYNFNKKMLGFAVNKIIDIKVNEYNQNSRLYDIEVDKVHNFVANEVVVHNCIDREVFNYKPTHVFIEALWVVPDKFDVLLPRYLGVKWYVRLHSKMPFLAGEGIAMEWLRKYDEVGKKYGNLWVSANNEDVITCFQDAYNIPVMHHPNIYCPEEYECSGEKSENKTWIDIGCFGAIRPMKNHLYQAIAAIMFGNLINKDVKFHVNVNRVEQHGEGYLKNIRNAFVNTRHTLVECPWQNHKEFIQNVRKMDIGTQVSFSESFNIVAADFVWNNIPIVGSTDIEWLNYFYKVSTTKIEEIVNALCIAYYGRVVNLQKLNKIGLDKYNRNATSVWLDNLRLQ